LTKRIIESGKIWRSISGNQPKHVSYEMRFLGPESLGEMLGLQELIIQRLEDLEVFRESPSQCFARQLSSERSVIGVLTEDGLIAYSTADFPGATEGNYGIDVGVPEGELAKACHIKAVAVHPAYRGDSLQRMLIRSHLDILKGLGYEHVCSTVSPKNTPSIENFLSQGFAIRAIKFKFEGRLRYVIHRDLQRTSSFGGDLARKSSLDVSGQQELLNQGLAGVRTERSPEGLMIVYCKLEDH
jgi:ribosomal protein S18 acetylase RimI-like enzyme